MLTYNISSLKTHLSQVLKKTRRGEPALIVDRNQAIAKLSRIEPADLALTEDAHLSELLRRGIVLPPESKQPRSQTHTLIKTRMTSAVKILLKEREESR